MNRETVLIVDDNVDFHTVASAVLLRSGYNVKSLYDGSIDEILLVAASCQLVLLDVDMPGESGVKISRQLKNDTRCHRIPIILISGNADVESLCRQSAADICLVKPFTASVLLQEVSRLLMSDSSHKCGCLDT